MIRSGIGWRIAYTEHQAPSKLAWAMVTALALGTLLMVIIVAGMS